GIGVLGERRDLAEVRRAAIQRPRGEREQLVGGDRLARREAAPEGEIAHGHGEYEKWGVAASAAPSPSCGPPRGRRAHEPRTPSVGVSRDDAGTPRCEVAAFASRGEPHPGTGWTRACGAPRSRWRELRNRPKAPLAEARGAGRRAQLLPPEELSR